jgi:biopolymer transport protein ExbD
VDEMKIVRKTLFMLLCLLVLVCGAVPALAAEPQSAAPAKETSIYNRKQIAFLVIDGTGQVNSKMRTLWQRQVRQAYPRAKYEFISDPQVLLRGQNYVEVQATDGVNESVLAGAAETMGADVVGLIVVNDMREYLVQSFFMDWDDGPETYLRVITSADLYMYKRDGDKFKKKKLRKVETTDISLAVSPYKEIQYAMSDLARSFEGLPLI